MICPDCGNDNINGVDECEQCGQPLVQFDTVGSEVEECITRHTTRVLCPKPPITVPSSVTVRTAIARMTRRKIGCLIVVDRGKLVGIFTERDVLDKISPDLSTLDLPVSRFMTRSPATISEDDSIAYAMQIMALGGYRHVPIIDATGAVKGLISVRDVLRFLWIRFSEVPA